MNVDLLVENGVIVIPKGNLFKGCLGIIGEKIVGIYDSPRGISAREKIDASGNYILPGLVEPHVHYGYRGNLNGNFRTETASAALGGITTVIPFYRDIQNPLSLYENLPWVKSVGEENSYIDFSLHVLLITRNQLRNVDKYLREYGISSFKFYMVYKGEDAKSIGLFGNETDDGFLYEAFSTLAGFPNLVACVHAENSDIILSLIEAHRKKGRDGLPVWSECRPNLTESESVHRVLTLAEAVGCPVYIVHLSTWEGLEEIRHFKRRYKKIFVETCPQYLSLTKEAPLGNLGKVNPPLRSSEDIGALWEGVSEGLIDTIGSDHCPFQKEDKQGKIWDARTGFPGSATLLPILLSEGVHKKKISLEKVAEIASLNPARIFNLFPRKGTIQVGSDADLCVLDLNLSKKVEPNMLQSCSDFSVYEGWTLRGWPSLTMVRGKIVMKNGQIVGEKGHGKFIPATEGQALGRG
jgi:dihydropyrimidinase